MKGLLRALTITLAIISLVTSVTCWAGVSVIVHPSNPDQLDRFDINLIFLGKRKLFPTAGNAIPIDQQEGSELHELFIRTILNKSKQQLKSYWTQKLFNGKATPPLQVTNEEQVKELVATNPALIGYIDSSLVDDSIKVIFEF